MTGAFQAFAVRGASGPVVTLQAGVDFAGYFWTTTSRRAGKVKAIRRDPAASVLTRTNDSWSLRAGRAVIFDPARPSDAIRELPTLALAGTALALIAARYPEQVLGYVVDAKATPQKWRLYNRVLLAVRHEDQITWTDEGLIIERTARFENGSDSRETPTSKLGVGSRCWLGIDSYGGPLVLPGQWSSARATVRVPAGVLAALRPRLPGPVCITIDDSDSPRPSDKTGIIVRGEASDYKVRAGTASIVVDVKSVTTWNGFRSTVTAA
jgi:hypothetical protein